MISVITTKVPSSHGEQDSEENGLLIGHFINGTLGTLSEAQTVVTLSL